MVAVVIGWRLALLAAVLALVVGIWTGNAWHEGRAAMAENVELVKQRADDRKAIDELKETAERLRQHGVDGALAYDQATERMGLIAQQLENDREETRRIAARQRADLEALAAARPDLRDMRLGDDFLRHWNRSNQGASGAGQSAAPAAAPEHPGKPAGKLPAAAAGQQQRPAGAVGQSRRDDIAVPGLQQARRLPGAGAGRMAGHGVALVLPGGGSLRPAGYRLYC